MLCVTPYGKVNTPATSYTANSAKKQTHKQTKTKEKTNKQVRNEVAIDSARVPIWRIRNTTFKNIGDCPELATFQD